MIEYVPYVHYFDPKSKSKPKKCIRCGWVGPKPGQRDIPRCIS